MRSEIQFVIAPSKMWLTSVVILIMIHTQLMAQSDSLRYEIAHYVSIDDAIYTNGRLMLRDLITTGTDRNKIRSVLWILQSDLNPVYKPLTRMEESGVYFFLNDFESVIKMFDHRENPIRLESYTDRPSDKLLETLRYKIVEDSARYAEAIDHTALDGVSKEFLHLYYAKIASLPWDNERRIALNKKADTFLREFPESIYDQSVRAHISELYGPTGWSQRIYLQGGYYQLTDHLSQRFTDPWAIGMGIDIAYKRLSLSFRAAGGDCVTRDSIPFTAKTWGKGFDVDFQIVDLAVGYKAVASERVDIVPFMGCSWTNFKPTEEDEKNDPVLKQIGFRQKPTYSVGLYTDIRIKRDKVENANLRFENFVRLRYTYEMPRLQRSMSGFDGTMHSITVGIGIAGIWQYRQL